MNQILGFITKDIKRTKEFLFPSDHIITQGRAMMARINNHDWFNFFALATIND